MGNGKWAIYDVIISKGFKALKVFMAIRPIIGGRMIALFITVLFLVPPKRL